MEIKAKIDQLRDEFAMANLNNSRVMEIIDELYKDNQRLRQLLNARVVDIDEQ